jgi:hypothetical protein
MITTFTENGITYEIDDEYLDDDGEPVCIELDEAGEFIMPADVQIVTLDK